MLCLFSQNHGHHGHGDLTEAQYQQYIEELWTSGNTDGNDVFTNVELHDIFVHYDTNSMWSF